MDEMHIAIIIFVSYREAGLRDAATSPDPVRKTQLKEKLVSCNTEVDNESKVT